MKLRCPRCQSRIAVPDEWAGRTIRCKGCNKAFRIPKPATTVAPTQVDTGLDMENLANLERSSMSLDGRDRQEAEADQQAEAQERASEPGGGPTVRVCPHCQKETPVKDPYTDVLCSNCWEAIPALVRGSSSSSSGLERMRVRNRVTGFYDGLAPAFAWPLGASGSLLTAAVAGIAVILLPVALFVGVAMAVEQGSAGLENTKPLYITGIQKGVYGFLILEIALFAAVAVHAFLDVVRATAIGADKAPDLVWNPSQWGSSIVAYLALLVYYALFAALALWLSSESGFSWPHSLDELRARLTPTVLGLLAVVTFVVPMHLMGIAVSSVDRGLNPVYVAKSLAGTHVHYLFLFVLVAVYAAMFAMAFWAVIHWFIEVLNRIGQAAATGDLVQVALGLLCWGLVVGFGFYGIFLLGRLHGLFARSFRRSLAFVEK